MSEDPRTRFRELPEPVRPEDQVETADVRAVPPEETELVAAWRAVHLGSG